MIEKLIENSKAQIDDILAQLRQIINEINSLNKFIKMYQADELDEVKLENFSYLNENDKIELLNLIKTLPKLDANVFSGQIKRIKEKINKIIDTIKDQKHQLELQYEKLNSIILNKKKTITILNEHSKRFISNNEIDLIINSLNCDENMQYELTMELAKDNANYLKNVIKSKEDNLIKTEIKEDFIEEKEEFAENEIPDMCRECLNEAKILRENFDYYITQGYRYSKIISSSDFSEVIEIQKKLKICYDSLETACLLGEPLDEYYQELLDVVDKANDLYYRLTSIEESKKDNFYDKEAKTLLIFLGENGHSTLENEMPASCINTIGKMKSVITMLPKEYDSLEPHKLKTDNYSKEFLQKYMVKEIKNGSNRIILSRFGVNFGKYVKKYENINHAIIVFGVCKSTPQDKKLNFEKALKTCYDNSDYIDEILNFLQIQPQKYEQLTTDEKKKYEEKVELFVENQNEMLKNLESSCLSNTNERKI